MSNKRQAAVVAAILSSLSLAACQHAPLEAAGAPTSVADTLSRAQAADGAYISWREHLVDDEVTNGGVPIRGGDGLQIADMDRDGIADIISVHEDSNHLRIAFGTEDPDTWVLTSVAAGPVVGAIEDVAVGDLDGDGWPDLVSANEEAHLAFFRNPGSAEATRAGNWPSHIPSLTKGRGSWLRVFIADIDGDGRNDVTAANKGAADIIDPNAPRADRTTSLFTIDGNPMDDEAWHEQTLLARDIPNTAMPVDFDGDGDLDVLAAARLGQQVYLLENTGTRTDGALAVEQHPVTIEPASPSASDCTITSTAFQSRFADMDGDGRLDLVVGVVERCGEADRPLALPALGWLQQPIRLDQPWRYHRIGDILPDMVIGIEVVDIDGDGHLDVVTGGYSGLNILRGGYTGATREYDHPDVSAASSVGRIAWFANPGNPAGSWVRHDISRRVRGMYDQFESRDMDGDGDMDLVATRGNSGLFDGVFWLEQVRSSEPLPAMTAARPVESKALPLPPANWIEIYERETTLVAPNKRPGPCEQ